MLRKLTTVVFLFLAALPAFAHGDFKFINGKWFDGVRFVPRTMYCVGTTFQSHYDGEITRTIDLGGKYVVPPFADAHNHLLGNPATADADEIRFLRAGIFYVKNPNNVAKFTAELREKFKAPEHVSVTYANGGFTATGGHPVQIYDALGARGVFPGMDAAALRGQAYVIVDSVADLDREWPRVLGDKPDFIKIYLEHEDDPAKRRGLDPAIVKPIVDRAHAAGLRVTAHVATAADFRLAIKSGADEIAHLPLESLTHDDAVAAAVAHATVVTTLISHRPTEGIANLDAINAANLRALKSAGVNVVVGTDNGEKNAVDEAFAILATGVYTPLELLTMWTDATARDIFPNRKIGKLDDGYEASLLALDGDPLQDFSAVRRIALRVKQGHVVEVPPDPAPDVTEAQLNRLGYEVLRANDTATAICLFELNARRWPSSANVWDSLAEAYLRAGRKEEAIANYRKSLALNPKNENAAKALRDLETAH